jgi:hypothetical protein
MSGIAIGLRRPVDRPGRGDIKLGKRRKSMSVEELQAKIKVLEERLASQEKTEVGDVLQLFNSSFPIRDGTEVGDIL